MSQRSVRFLLIIRAFLALFLVVSAVLPAVSPKFRHLFFAYSHYFRIAKALSTEGKKVNIEGAKYLREILTGQSHCVAEGD